ncbi:MAG: type II toxin-antitoxin system PemK/MazF family toxin [Magnetococcales bacterium]|nr:type II toxin-antitoxin system PemK/MazF family toxin [Magnetococcales bacterium]
MMFQSCDLVMVPFPFSDLKSAKKRPVLVLTMPDHRGDFIGLAVTSISTVQCALEIDIDAITEGSLPKQSWLRLDKIFTLNIFRVIGVCARVKPAFRFFVLQQLCANLHYDGQSLRREP